MSAFEELKIQFLKKTRDKTTSSQKRRNIDKAGIILLY